MAEASIDDPIQFNIIKRCKMLYPHQLHEYQRQAITHQLTHDDSMMWLQMGLGKTPITLTTIVDRMRAGQVQKTLIFGPLRVITSVWEREARKWDHTKHLNFSTVHGTKDKRSRALFREADIYLINYEAMNWLAETLDHYYTSQGKPLPFQMIVYDEVSKMKNSGTMRMAGGTRDRKDARGELVPIKKTGWRKMLNGFKYRTGLTGTPASNGYLDLFGQFLAVDGGQRLGEYVTHYKDSYFKQDYNGWNFEPTEIGAQMIESKISDIVISMDAKDHLDMPDCIVTNMMVDLPLNARKAYDQMEAEMFTELDNGSELEVFSRSSVSNKCLQFCNGSPYVASGSLDFEILHDAKLDALEEVLEEAGGAPVLCSYSFKADAARIMKKFKKYRPVNLTAAKASDTGKIIDRWNKGEIKLLIGHPASMGHGVDGLQDSGSILVWFGINWSLELYLQMIARLDRQGQTRPVSVIRILCNDTVDLAVADAIGRKEDGQESLKSAIDRYRRGYTTNDLTLNFY
jgi:SNF2 family DNA or RNA helicase